MFKQFIAVLAIALVLASEAAAQQSGPAPAAPSKGTVKVRRRTGLKLQLLQPLDSETAKVGDDVPLRLARPLIVNNITILEAGELVHGKVVHVSKAGPKCHEGNVAVELKAITFHDGSTAKAQIWNINASPDVNVPPRLFKEAEGEGALPPINEWYEVIPAVPIYIFYFVCISPFLALIPLAILSGSSCDTPGKEFHLPANATVAVMISKDHRVSY
jgi:hypothetical protein